MTLEPFTGKDYLGIVAPVRVRSVSAVLGEGCKTRSSTRTLRNSGNVCLGPSLQNHGLITGWKFLCGLSSCMEIIVVRVFSDFWFLPCQGSLNPCLQRLRRFTTDC